MREHLADPAGILVIDETGFLKKGTKSAGVKRQYSGTAGKRENCQIGVFVAYSSLVPTQTQVLVDRELYLPQEWASDRERRHEAGVPEDVTFATKPGLVKRMLARLRAGELSAAWVTGDTVCGGSGPLRAWLEEQRQPYLLAIAACPARREHTCAACRAGTWHSRRARFPQEPALASGDGATWEASLPEQNNAGFHSIPAPPLPLSRQ